MHSATTTDFESAEKFILNRLKNELPAELFYHGYHHTIDVMNAAMKIADAENISEEERKLLRIAVAFHDAGFIYVYKNHEEKGCEMAKENLSFFGFTPRQIELICNMIIATKIPQKPKNKLEGILCDADLDYLGRGDVYPIAQTLFEESKIFLNIGSEKKWNEVQINFLKNHCYYTSYALQQRQPKKQRYLAELLKKI
jgi:predicted metal-dependent HD superfamily phosphohydrolase